MSNRLREGQRRVIRKRRWFYASLPFDVAAYCEDSETPYVELVSKEGLTISLTDTQAAELIDRLQRALDILPTSK